ncbi:hypothetical protein JRQ81_008805 [Phrynocephalus forsythii]|uniref:SURP and G-patch domain-containing protein 2 n=1 Tax=Phrynocephalus forsythii TaxID=171643 RepID=A0A9Q0XB95_9SAUR|nr:hypothetical protein JRQ81_008805 [Phrynocephalus forsythii]
MASRRIAQDSFDALVQAKAKRYRLDQSDPINKALQQLRAHPRLALQAPYGDEDEDPREDRAYGSSAWRKEPRADYAAPSYRSSSRALPEEEEEEDYYEKTFPQPLSRSRGYPQPPLREQGYSRPSSAGRDYGGLPLRDLDYGRPSAREFRSSGLPDEDFAPGGAARRPCAEVERVERGGGPPAAAPLPPPCRPCKSLPRPRVPKEDAPGLAPVDPDDVFAAFGREIIKWAGFDRAKQDRACLELFQSLFAVETETCAKTLAAFKCRLNHEHQQFCLYSLKNIQHPALRKPQVDNTFLNFLMSHQVMETKQAFFEVIGPFDRVLMKLQYYLLKSATPLLMACNAYELHLKTGGLCEPAQVSSSLETTASLCRKALVLLGQTFALASAERQEKILDALGIQQGAPSPALFPNVDSSALFGREYIEHLQSWLDKSGCKMQLRAPDASPPGQGPPVIQEAKPKAPPRADRKLVATIENLVSDTISGVMTEKARSKLTGDPQYWFLSEEESLEHQYYKLKLSEAERLKAEEGKSPEWRAAEAVRALLYRKKIAGLKKRLFPRRKAGILQRAARSRRGRKATVGTQTPFWAGTAPGQEAQGDADSGADANLPEASAPGSDELSLESQFPDVDLKTMVTARKLAEFVAEIGPEIEQFSIDNSADNPDLWFLQDQESSAFRYYRLKVQELCPSICFGPATEATEELPDAAKEAPETLKEEPPPSEAGAEGSSAAAGVQEAEEAGTAAGTLPEGSTEAQTESPSGAGGSAASSLDPSPRVPVRGTPFGRKRVSSKSLKVGLIPAPKRVCLIDEPKIHDPVQIAYDRPCGYPAYKNKKRPKDLTFEHKRLNQKNIGFQMLKKMGWKEGRGLGSHGEGIKEPVRMGSTSAGEGLGVMADKKEDTFATFRQRMMQMYYMKRGDN